ncbi:hypothetical protein GCM10010519_69660 [Streptomyces lactacystinicus]
MNAQVTAVRAGWAGALYGGLRGGARPDGPADRPETRAAARRGARAAAVERARCQEQLLNVALVLAM